MTKFYLFAVLAGYTSAEKSINKDVQVSFDKSDGPENPWIPELYDCNNTNYWNGNELVDSYGDACSDYYGNTQWCGLYDTFTFNS